MQLFIGGWLIESEFMAGWEETRQTDSASRTWRKVNDGSVLRDLRDAEPRVHLYSFVVAKFVYRLLGKEREQRVLVSTDWEHLVACNKNAMQKECRAFLMPFVSSG